MFTWLRLIVFAVSLFGVLVPPVHGQDISATWTKKQSVQWFPNGPGPRGWSKLFYDQRSQRIAIYGGSAGAGYKSDVWQYDTHNDLWTGIEVPDLDCPGFTGISGPNGRDAHSAEYDPFNHLYWSVAGGGYKCGASHSEKLPVRTAGTGTTTTKIVDSSLSASDSNFYKDWMVTVGSYASYVTAYDPSTKTLTLATPITGLTPGSTYTVQFFTDGQTWFYSPTSRQWASLEGPHWGSIRPSPVVTPPNARHTPGFAYSSKDNVLIFQGGGLNGQGSNDTWALDLRTKTWSQKKPDSATGFPFRLQELTNDFVYDEANDVFIIFGGRCASDSRCQNGKPTGDTWAYKFSTNTWTKMTPSVSPPARIAGAMYYDRNTGLVVLFGGATVDIYNQYPTSANLLNDLWVYRYSNNTWTQISTANAPSARYLQMMAFDRLEGKAVLYSGNAPATSSEVWTLEIVDPTANPLPVAAIAATTSGSSTTNFNFSGAHSFDRKGYVASYAWDFGDGSTGSGVEVTHNYASAAAHAVRLTVTNNLGASATAWYRADASGGSAPLNQIPVAIAADSPAAGTTSTVFSFNAAGSSDSDGTIASYSWNFGDGTTASGSSATHQFAAAGSYTVTLTVQDNMGALATTSMVVTVGNSTSLPTISFQRQISGMVQNGTVTQVLADGVAVPFTTSGSNFTATLSVTSPRTVSVTVQATGTGGPTTQTATVAVP